MPFQPPNQQRQSTEGKIFFKTSEGKKSKLANQHSHGKCPIVYALINTLYLSETKWDRQLHTSLWSTRYRRRDHLSLSSLSRVTKLSNLLSGSHDNKHCWTDSTQLFHWVSTSRPCRSSTRYTCITVNQLISTHWLWSPYVIGQTIIFSSCFFFLSSFFPHLISAVGDWMFTILWHMVWP